jgi:DNA-binding CsgD family transcriptional regulator
MAFPSFVFDGQPLETLFRNLNSVTWVVSIVVMLFMAWTLNRITYTIRRQNLQISIACMMSIGTIFLFIAEYVPFVPLIIAGNVLAGVSSAFLFLIWGEAFRRQETPSIAANTILSCIIALLSYGIMAVLPTEVTSAILCIMPLFVVTGLFFVLHGGNAFFGKQEFLINDEGQRMPIFGIREVPTFRKLRVHRGKLMIRLAIPSFLFGVAFGPLTLQTFTLIREQAASSTNLMVTIAGACAVAVALVITLLLINRDEDYMRFYRFIIPVLAITVFFINFLEDGLTLNLFTFVTFICFSFMMWVEFSELSRRYRISPILIFGFGRAAAVTAQFISIVVLETLHIDQFFSANGNVLSTLLILAMLLGYFFLPRDKAIREMAIMDYPDPAKMSAEGSGPKEAGKGRFIVRCEHVANTYLLSSREADVLYLLAKGRNAAYIGQKLFISEGTVHTHTWRIYRKMNVHAQQELMDLVDSYFVHDDGRVEKSSRHQSPQRPSETEPQTEHKVRKRG